MKNLYYSLIPASIRISVPKRVSPGQKKELGVSTMRRNLRRLGIGKSPALGMTEQ